MSPFLWTVLSHSNFVMLQRALESQRAVLERKLETVVATVTDKLEAERNEAHISMVNMEQKLDLISTEVRKAV